MFKKWILRIKFFMLRNWRIEIKCKALSLYRKNSKLKITQANKKCLWDKLLKRWANEILSNKKLIIYKTSWI